LKNLTGILPKNINYQVLGPVEQKVNGLTLDSRKVAKGYLFAALAGSETNGALYIKSAIENGATTILCSAAPDEVADGITYVITKKVAHLLGFVADKYFDSPSSKFDLVGITGTNGKTTTATLLYQLFKKLGYKCGLISTAGIRIHDNYLEATHTTPDTVALNQLLSDMAEADCDFVFMEVSSHAVVQDRIAGLRFKGGIFTNLTHDHLDYHKTFENYRDAKKGFFDGLDDDAFALVNTDDRNGRFMLQNTRAMRVTYALQKPADFNARIIEYDVFGMMLEIDGAQVYVHLMGRFNAYNLLAAYGAARLLDIPREQLIRQISALTPAEGRFATIHKGGITAIVDYAHTPDALANVLETINDINIQGRRVITVIGCGGNRDRAKRPIMAKIAANQSHLVILTSDNPRNEDPIAIIHEMETGIPVARRADVLSITDRYQAIRTAITMAGRGDIVLVAGKGHETYQEISGVKHPFNDFAVLNELLNTVNK
jgi:UDP-N-acetylmuramoyl-L-alanyl-D-glutamate--2,6-diaminopimelate ligase